MINEKKEDYRESFVRTDAHEKELAQLSLCYPTDDDMDLDIIFPVVQNLLRALSQVRTRDIPRAPSIYKVDSFFVFRNFYSKK